jgi:hypothetical protein
MVACDSCGQEVEADGQFCPWCFALVAAPALVTAPPAAAPAPPPPAPTAPPPAPGPAPWEASAAPAPWEAPAAPAPAANPWSARPQPQAAPAPPTPAPPGNPWQAPPPVPPARNQWEAPAAPPGNPWQAPPPVPPNQWQLPTGPPSSPTSKLAEWSGWRRMGSIAGVVVVLVSILVRTGIADQVIHMGWAKEKRTAQSLVLQAADMDASWTPEGVEDDDDTTIGLSDTEADCLDVSPARPVAEASGPAFVREGYWVSSAAGVWRSEGAARKGAEHFARPEWGECATKAIDKEVQKDFALSGDATTAFMAVQTLPGSVPITRLHVRLAVSNRDGTMSITEAEVFQAFKGRAQVVVFTITAGGMPTATATELVERMLSRVT